MIRTKRGAPKFILVGNKNDKQQQREVTYEDGAAQARAWNCRFYETSAKTRYNVEETFTTLVRLLRDGDKEKPEANAKPPRTTEKPIKKPSFFRKACVIL
jgi:GTPase SAR1 family protein